MALHLFFCSVYILIFKRINYNYFYIEEELENFPREIVYVILNSPIIIKYPHPFGLHIRK